MTSKRIQNPESSITHIGPAPILEEQIAAPVISNPLDGAPRLETRHHEDLVRPIGRVVLYGAMATEIRPFIEDLAMQRIVADSSLPWLSKVPYPIYKAEGRDIYLVQTNVGMGNAGIGLGASLPVLQPQLAVKIGCVGASSPGVKKSEVVIPERFFNIGAWITRPGADKPTSDAVQWSSLFGELPFQNNQENLGGPYTFKPDRDLAHIYEEIVQEMGIPYQRVVLGSGDMVITDRRFLDHIRRDILKGLKLPLDSLLCADNESYTIAQACHRFGIPMISANFVASSDYDDEPYDPDSIEMRTREIILPVVRTLLQRLHV